jgi:peptide/nickel transport system ATP-binding protein
MTAPLVRIRDLSLEVAGRPVLRSVDLDLPRGGAVGLVGESGSGKTTLALALLGLLPANADRPRGAVEFDGVELLALSEAERRRWRGRRIAMVFQDPLSALNPVFTVGAQLIDVVRATRPEVPSAARREHAVEMLARVGIPDPRARFAAYPHELSGGMRQRAIIALALLCQPDLLIADEPTTALDATIGAQILRLFAELKSELRSTILFISHSLGLVAELCDEVAVMYAGEIVEHAPAAALFAAPRHPYARALLACETDESAGGRAASIPGEPPDLGALPSGCVFAPRCPQAAAVCASAPALRELGEGRRAACHFA